MTKTATLIKKLAGFRGDARVYSLSEPLDGHDKVVVSSVTLPFGYGSETYIFPSDGETVSDWGELHGSQKNTLSHEKVPRDAGYEVA